ncbi:MAG: hypothetical protein WCA32_17365 [Chromatiaceae bacterium]
MEHVLGMLAAGDDFATLLEGYPWSAKTFLPVSRNCRAQ